MQPSPVVYADSKFCGTGRFLCVDVRFRDRAELDRLIDALVALRDGSGDDADHLHLQNGGAGRAGAPAEVTFHRPAGEDWTCSDDGADLCGDAKRWLQAAMRVFD